MKNWIRFAAVAALAVVLAMPVFASDDVRIGDFYKEIAKFRNIAAGDGATAERALRAQGVRLPNLDLSKVLTEGDMVRISEAMGVRVKTQRPEAPVSQSQVNAYTKTFGADLTGIGTNNPQQPMSPPRPDPNPDKGKSKGFYKSPTQPV